MQRKPTRSLKLWQVPSQIQPVQAGGLPHSTPVVHGQPSPPPSQEALLHEGKIPRPVRRSVRVVAAMK
ncbi:hypothetical protein [Polyangium aurulentum]|uniref:hypothetical protein n=1 Tax=Polyangium aurulentum TaxID=2567896 RepID=UPI0020104F28|nr:hypothetical protein [Polyangium aurulentum]UQA61430.1 hypothetical protein E8A73_013520 [Polyangium aurulentum]